MVEARKKSIRRSCSAKLGGNALHIFKDITGTHAKKIQGIPMDLVDREDRSARW